MPHADHILRLLCAVILVLIAAGASAETLTFDGGATLDEIMARHPGWSYYQARNGRTTLEPGPTGKCLAFGYGGGFSPAQLSRAFPNGMETIFVGFSVKLGSIERNVTGTQLLWLTSGGKTDVRLSLGSSRQITLTTNLTQAALDQYPGAYWWPDEWTRLVLGVRKGPSGYVKLWADGALVYSNSFDTGSNLIDGLVIGLPNGWDGEWVTAVTQIDDLSIGTSFEQVGTEPRRTITVSTTIERIVNPDCFGVHVGWYGWGWRSDYPKIKELLRQAGVYGGRVAFQSHVDWDYHWPHFMYKPTDTDPPGSTAAEHIFAMSSGPDPIVSCVLNMLGEKGADWRPEKAVDLILFNQRYRNPNGSGGLRAVYGLGNEPVYPNAITEGWYYKARTRRYQQVGNGNTTWRSAFDPGQPEFLSNTSPAYNYKLDLLPGDYLYIGHRWRFNTLAYALVNAGRVSGDKLLRWEYWNGTEWVRFGTVPHSSFVGEYPKPARNLTGNRNWNTCDWDDAAMPEWARTSMAAVAGDDAFSREELYYIRIGHESGSYSGESPVESFMKVAVSPLGYLEAMQVFYPAVVDAGAELYTSPGNEGASTDLVDILEENPGLFDGLMWHSYPDPSTSAVLKPGVLYAPPSSMLWTVDRISKRAAEFRRRVPGKKIAICEWNACGTTSTGEQGLAGGLRTAVALCEILRSGWDSAMYHKAFSTFFDPFNLVTGTIDQPRLRPSGWAFKAVREHSKRYVLRTESSYRGIYACAFAANRSSEGALFVINRTPNTESVQVTFPRAWKTKMAVYEMKSASLTDDNEKAENISLRLAKTFSGATTITYRFPPYSLTIFETR